MIKESSISSVGSFHSTNQMDDNAREKMPGTMERCYKVFADFCACCPWWKKNKVQPELRPTRVVLHTEKEHIAPPVRIPMKEQYCTFLIEYKKLLKELSTLCIMKQKMSGYRLRRQEIIKKMIRLTMIEIDEPTRFTMYRSIGLFYRDKRNDSESFDLFMGMTIADQDPEVIVKWIENPEAFISS